MIRKTLYIVAFLVAGAASAWGQNAPERSELRHGNRLYEKGNYAKSLEYFLRAQTYNPQAVEPKVNMGNALYKSEQWDDALKVMSAVAADSLQSEKSRAEAFYNLGNAQFQKKELQKALDSFKQSLMLNPDDQEAKFNYAYTKKMLEDQQQQGGGDDNKDQNQDQNKDQNQDQNKDQQNDQNQENQDQGDQNKDQGDQGEDQKNEGDPQDQDENQDQGNKGDEEQDGEPQQAPSELSQEQMDQNQQMLDAIQANEDKTQEKLKEGRGVVVRGTKNW